ncbi:MAG TPA: MgtC/SapB family protein [Bacteroidia bacterium]|jgi:putative Mg2+ transporter-C (MgtC) family protein|nr:MgtC/SapB family protein [Bacteroidia bacterium]
MANFVEENSIKLIVSLLAGAIIGAEREYKSKNAGFRTIILITVGSTLFTIISFSMAGNFDPTRIASNIITGVGFLGAGAIFREGLNVKGLTTAATIWISAAIGMAIGAGQYEFAGVVLLIVMLILLGFSPLQKLIDNYNTERIYKMTFYCNAFNMEEIHDIFISCKLKSKCISQVKRHDMVTLTFNITGGTRNHQRLIQELHTNTHIIEFEA